MKSKSIRRWLSEEEFAEYKKVRDKIWICPYSNLLIYPYEPGKEELPDGSKPWWYWMRYKLLNKRYRGKFRNKFNKPSDPLPVYDPEFWNLYERMLKNKIRYCKWCLTHVKSWGDVIGIKPPRQFLPMECISLKFVIIREIELIEKEIQNKPMTMAEAYFEFAGQWHW